MFDNKKHSNYIFRFYRIKKLRSIAINNASEQNDIILDYKIKPQFYSKAQEIVEKFKTKYGLLGNDFYTFNLPTLTINWSKIYHKEEISIIKDDKSVLKIQVPQSVASYKMNKHTTTDETDKNCCAIKKPFKTGYEVSGVPDLFTSKYGEQYYYKPKSEDELHKVDTSIKKLEMQIKGKLFSEVLKHKNEKQELKL